MPTARGLGHVAVAVRRPLPATASRRPGRPGRRPAFLALDLPIGPMAAEDRLAAVRRQMEARLRRGEAEAEALVMRAVDILPAPLQRIAAERICRERLSRPRVSMLPGTRRQHRLLAR